MSSPLAPLAIDEPLLPYQRLWVADTSPVKLFTKSRRIGVSWAEAADCALVAACGEAGGQDVTYICYDHDITRQFIRDCAAWAGLYDLAAGEISQSEEVWREGDRDKSVLIFEIKFASGHSIQAIAGTPRKLRGRKGRVVIDEAAFLDCFSEVLEAALALLIWGGQVHIITTYNGTDNEYYDLEQEVLAGQWPYSRHFVTFSEAVGQGLYQRICQVSGRPWSLEAEREFIEQTRAYFGERAAQELDCIPRGSSGKYFNLAVLERAMQAQVPILSYECRDGFAALPELERQRQVRDWLRLEVEAALVGLDPNLRCWFGLDFARSGDISVLAVIQEQGNLQKWTVLGVELRNVPFEQQREIVFFVGDRLPRFVGAALDATGNGSYLAEVAWQRWGAERIHRVSLSRNFYGEWFARYRAALEEGEFVLPKSADWRDDHRIVELDRGVPILPATTIKGADGKPRHGDSVVACLLADYAARNTVFAPIEYESLPADGVAQDWGFVGERGGLAGFLGGF